MKAAIKWGNKITAGFIILFTLLAVFAPSLPMVVPFTEYLFHVLILMLISGLIGLVISSRTVMFTAFGCAMVLAIFLKNASNEDLRSPDVNLNTSIKVAHINLSSVSDVETLQQVLSNDSLVEIYSFQEYTPDWATIMPSLMKAKYPNAITDIQIDVYGKAVFSKYPFSTQSQPKFGGIKIIDVNVVKERDTFKVASSYIIPALDSVSTFRAKLQMKEMQTSFKKYNKHLIVMGEFNQVYWTSEIIEFRKQCNLSNSRREVKISQSKMPYNHIFYSNDLECFSFAELEDNEGTHLGCIGSFQIKNPVFSNQ